ncbi:uncharacterized protein LOC131625409 [Vicia villosa]|uniref:uncharacterized protein LOC131625409 n=1 Tax=Vicia villosa TaxID=3911 RepID=UPI00273B29BA|nr:uncharacterized protein LOC131625409 [Vicia villosa]
MLASAFGTPIVTDEFTTSKLRVSYARVLVEVDITQKLLEEIVIKDKEGNVVIQKVEYEWRPNLCEKCQAVGHNCEFKIKKKQWQPKNKTISIEKQQEVKEEEHLEAKKEGTAEVTTTPNHAGLFDDTIWTVIGKQGSGRGKSTEYAGTSNQIHCENGYGVLGHVNEPLVAFDRGPC